MSVDPLLIPRVMMARTRTQKRDRWSRERLLEHQSRALARVRARAVERSSYYRSRLAGFDAAPLHDLPVLTKQTLMAEWDAVCTDPRLRLSDLEARLDTARAGRLDPGHAWRGRWWVAATGGTTGRRAALAWDRREWTQILTSYARVNDWAGVGVDVRNPVRTAIVSSLDPTHQSAVVGASLNSRLVPTLRLDARTSLPDLAAALDEFQPRLLVAYASMVGILAGAQLDGALHVHPAKVVAASEVLTSDARAAAQRAWGAGVVVDTYAATETATIASTCEHGGWHLYEDFVVAEPVDAEYRPVPTGETAERLLVTPLFARTLPLIRYELTDSVRLSKGSCPCGRPFALLESVEGRTEDTLLMRGSDGPVRVHPVVFHSALESLAPDGWQVEQTQDGLLVRLAGRSTRADLAAERVTSALAGLGVVGARVDVVLVPEVTRTPLGKAPLVRALSHDR